MKTLEPQSILVAAKLRGEENPLLTALAELYGQGVRTISVEFSGGGDSGDIDSIEFYNKDGALLSLPDENLPEKMTDLFHEVITKKVTYDWYNNEGGGGELRFDLDTLEMHVRSYFYEQIERDGDNYSEPIRGTEEL